MLLVLAVILIPLSVSPAAIWSPYYYVTVHPFDESVPAVSKPLPDLRTMRDPPMYLVSVNTDFYQWDGTLDLRRYTPGLPYVNLIKYELYAEYMLPYILHPQAANVCVVGAGGGLDMFRPR